MGGMPRHSGQFSRDSGTFWEFRRFADLAYLLVFWTPSSVWNLGMVSRASRGGHQVSENTCDDFGIVMPITTLLCAIWPGIGVNHLVFYCGSQRRES